MRSCSPIAEPSTPGSLPEARRNALLRRLDWRFLLHVQEAPRTVDLTSGGTSKSVREVLDTVPAATGRADLVVAGRPRRGGLRTAREALGPGGELVCLWRLPLPGAPARARRRLEQAGFSDVRVYWPGPLPHRTPQFWLPLGSPGALAHLLAERPLRSRADGWLRRLWRTAARAGLLFPLCAVARAGAAEDAGRSADEIDSHLPATPSWLLLTGGHRSINKVVGLPFGEGSSEPPLAVKFARVPEAEPPLDREAEVLRLLEDERPDLQGVPRVRARSRRAGRLALAESAVHGRSLLDLLTPANFGELALGVTGWLIELAGSGPARPASEWWPRLVAAPLDEFEHRFGSAVEPGTGDRIRGLLEGLGDLPQVCEHRDCSPWNVVLTAAGAPALLDWESAEPRGLPGLDLVYFLANAAFVLDGALESGRTRETYARLLDPSTSHGEVAAACLREYTSMLGIDEDSLRRLRLLCWIVHSRSEYRHREMDLARVPGAAALRGGVFLGLLEEELRV